MLHLLISVLHSSCTWFRKATISSVPANAEVDVQQAGTCSLCLESRKHASVTSCGHLFCWHCILNWLQTNNQCPVCRDVLEPSRVIPLMNYCWQVKGFFFFLHAPKLPTIIKKILLKMFFVTVRFEYLNHSRIRRLTSSGQFCHSRKNRIAKKSFELNILKSKQFCFHLTEPTGNLR